MSLSNTQLYPAASAYTSPGYKAVHLPLSQPVNSGIPSSIPSGIPSRSPIANTLTSFSLSTPVGPLQVWSRYLPSINSQNPFLAGQPIMLLVHGLGGQAKDMAPLAQELAQAFPAMSFVGLTLPEIAKPTGQLAPQHHFTQQSISQVRNTIDYLSQQPGQSRLYVLTYSLGAPITIHALSQSQSKQGIAGLLLMAPAFDFSPSLNQSLYQNDSPSNVPLQYGFTQWSHDNELRPLMRQSANILKQNLNTIPHHIFISQRDDAVSLPAIQQSLNQASDMTILPNGSHEWMTNGYLPDLANQMVAWLNSGMNRELNTGINNTGVNTGMSTGLNTAMNHSQQQAIA